jgi:hypothetical protein
MLCFNKYLRLEKRLIYVIVLVIACAIKATVSGQFCSNQAEPILVRLDSTSATITWFKASQSLGVQVEYGPQGFSIGQGTRQLSMGSSITLQSLLPNTAYEVHLRDSCGAGNLSSWSNPLYFSTVGDTLYQGLLVEHFLSNSLPTHWGNAGLDNSKWEIIDPNYTSGFKAPRPPVRGMYDISDSVASGYAFTRANLLKGNNHLSTPFFSVAALSQPVLNFWLFRNDTNNVPAFPFKVWAQGAGQKLLLLDYPSNHPFWRHFELGLDTLPFDTMCIVFEYYRVNGLNGSRSDILLDGVEVVSGPTCSQPNVLKVDTITENSARVLVENSTAVGHNLKLTLPGLGQFINYQSNTDTFHLLGLPSSTTLRFYLQDSCANGQTSAWSGPWFFNTQCGVTQAPVHYPFYNEQLYCFQRYGSNANSFWEFPQPNAIRIQSADFVSDKSKVGRQTTFLRAEFGFSPETKILETPPVNVSALSQPYFSFFNFSYNDGHYPDSTQNNTLFVDVKDLNDIWIEFYKYQGNDTNWTYHGVALPPWGDTLNIRLRAQSPSITGRNNTLLIDDIRIDNRPACLRPDSLHVSQVNDSSATLSWMATSTNTLYEITYGPAEFYYSQGTKLYTASDSVVLVGLRANERYKVYLRTICGSDTSERTLGKVFTTPCGVEGRFPFFENFQQEEFGATVLINCWSIVPQSNLSWQVTEGNVSNLPGLSNTGPLHDPSGIFNRRYLVLNSALGSPGDSSILITETYNLNDLVSPELNFQYHMYGQDMGKLEVLVDTGGSTPVSIWSRSGQQQMGSGSAWSNANLDLTSFKHKPIQLIFSGTKGAGLRSAMALDNIRLLDSCLLDTAGAAFQYTIDTIALNAKTYRFTAQDTGAIEYRWAFGDGGGDTTFLPTTIYTYRSNGNYTVQLSVTDNCNGIIVFESDTLIIQDISLPQWQKRKISWVAVYPNPASSLIHIEKQSAFPAQGSAKLTLTDSRGKQLETLEFNKKIVSLEISLLAEGVYFLIISSEYGNEVIPWVKK